jgi:hypothetical protein
MASLHNGAISWLWRKSLPNSLTSMAILKVDASRYSYRLIKILSDKKVGPQRRFTITLKAPTGPPFFNVDESSNIYLFGEVKISIINAKLKARLLQLLKTSGPMDLISGDFKHDQMHDNVITLIGLQHTKL